MIDADDFDRPRGRRKLRRLGSDQKAAQKDDMTAERAENEKKIEERRKNKPESGREQ